MWKKKTETRSLPTPTVPTEYPAGTFVHSEKGWFYIFDTTKRYRILSERVLWSWAPHRVVETTEAALAKYKIPARLKFRNGSLIKDISNGKIYLIESGKLRQIVNPDALVRIGVDPGQVERYAILASDEEVALHEVGKVLS